MPRPRKRRQYKTGSLFQKCEPRWGCPPLDDNGDRPDHRCKGRWYGTIEAGYTKTGARRRITVSAKTEADAKQKLDQKKRARDRGEEAQTRTTVKAWADQWIALTEKTVRPKTHTTDRGAVAAWIIPTIGHKRLDALTPADIRAVHTAITGAGNTTSTANRYHGVLHRLLLAARDEGHPVPARVLEVKAPIPNVNDRTAIPIPDCLAMLSVAAELPHGTRWVAAFLQGMRRGECLGLTWDQIRGDHLLVSWQLQALPYRDKNNRQAGFRIPDGYEVRQVDRSLHLVRPKSKAGWRRIPIVDVMADGLERWRRICPDSPHGLVWPAADGTPADTGEDRDEWRAIQDTVGVRHPTGRYYDGHEARHSTATLLLELGVPESVRVAIMGHSSMASTRGYEHVSDPQTRDALNRMATRLQLG